MTDIIKLTRKERGKELMERLASGRPYPHDQRYIDALRGVILEGDGEIYYIDGAHGDNLNDGLTMATAWQNRQAIRGVKPGDVLVIDGYVFVKRTPWLEVFEHTLEEGANSLDVTVNVPCDDDGKPVKIMHNVTVEWEDDRTCIVHGKRYAEIEKEAT